MIDYLKIHKSIEYYEKENFSRIESPWTVSEYVDNLTKPKDRISFQLKHNNKCLVASGEQSFLYLYLKDFLPKGSFQTVTPCFRFESFDYLHTKYFIKNELIKTDVVDKYELEKIINIALGFFQPYFNDKLEVVKTNDFEYDINIGDNELGSYGIRETNFIKWIYGTGCAEPRLTNLIKKYNGLS